MRILRSFGRSIILLSCVARALILLLIQRPATRQQRAEWLHRLCAHALRRLKIEVVIDGKFPERGAVISNHLGYLDILVLASLHRCVFVSKAEIESWPVVGWMTTIVGTVYVARGHGGSAVRARAGMREALDAGLPVVFFPEGTTSNGEGLLKFHSGLLAQVLAEGAEVTPAYLRYSLAEDNGPDVTVEEDVCYWGDHHMGRHLFRLLGLRGITAHIRFSETPMSFSNGGRDRKLAAREARAEVAALGDREYQTLHHF